MNKLKFFKIFLLLLPVQFHFLKTANNDPSIVLTLQYPNSRMVSKIWDLYDFNTIILFKNLLDDVQNQNHERLMLPLQQEHNHVTHEYLKNLITGNITPHSLEQYLKDYHYFIGDKDINLGDPAYKTVKAKVFREHYDDFRRNINNKFFRDFAWFDFDNFLKQKLEIDFANVDIARACLDHDKIPFNYEQIIELVSPTLTITMAYQNQWSNLSSLVTVQANRYIEIDSPALFNLIKLIKWKKYINEYKDWSKDDLAEEYSLHFEQNHTIFSEISLKNFFFKGLHLEPIVHNTNKISFEKSDITISENDISTLQKIQENIITEPAPGLLDFYDPYWHYWNAPAHYNEHFLEIDFGSSRIENPNKLLDLVDIHNGYFQTILIKNAQVSLVALKRIQFLCRKLARAKFCLSLVLNLIIIITLFKYNRWILGTIGSILSLLIQRWGYYNMVEYPENEASVILKKPFNTNGGVTFKFD